MTKIKNQKNKTEAEWFLNKRPSARLLFNEDLGSRWHPKLGGRLVALREVNNGYDTKEEAIEAAKGFKNHCARIMGVPDFYKL